MRGVGVPPGDVPSPSSELQEPAPPTPAVPAPAVRPATLPVTRDPGPCCLRCRLQPAEAGEATPPTCLPGQWSPSPWHPSVSHLRPHGSLRLVPLEALALGSDGDGASSWVLGPLGRATARPPALRG